jgi:hypothetical protein
MYQADLDDAPALAKTCGEIKPPINTYIGMDEIMYGFKHKHTVGNKNTHITIHPCHRCQCGIPHRVIASYTHPYYV